MPTCYMRWIVMRSTVATRRPQLQRLSVADRSVRLPLVHIWRIRGEQVCNGQVLNDTLTTARLLGLA
jgi:hypothetical protein